MPVARKLWQFIVGGSPALLARRLIIWKTICLFMRVPLSRDLVTSSAWCLGLWTDVAGLASSDPPETSQSKHLLMADRCCLTDGRDRGRCSTYAATWMGLMESSRWIPRRSHQSMNRETAR